MHVCVALLQAFTTPPVFDCVSIVCLPDITYQFSQAFPVWICILQAIKS